MIIQILATYATLSTSKHVTTNVLSQELAILERSCKANVVFVPKLCPAHPLQAGAIEF